MTYTTPAPVGQPDFMAPTAQPGISLLDISGHGTGGIIPPALFCGNNPAVNLYVRLGNLTAYGSVVVGWYLDAAATQLVTSLELYAGAVAASTSLTITDTLPVQAPYMLLTIAGDGTNDMTWNVVVSTSNATVRGVSQFAVKGLPLIVTSQVCGAGLVTDFYADAIMPGQYSYYLRCEAALTGTLTLGVTDGHSGVLGVIDQMVNPSTNTVVKGTCVLATLQAIVECNNTGVSSPHVDAYLVGPQV